MTNSSSASDVQPWENYPCRTTLLASASSGAGSGLAAI